ncbi:hypothetical protein CH063_00656, partial [Colletotrichum higginsianum]
HHIKDQPRRVANEHQLPTINHLITTPSPQRIHHNGPQPQQTVLTQPLSRLQGDETGDGTTQRQSSLLRFPG